MGRSAPLAGLLTKACDFWELSTVKHVTTKRAIFGQTRHLEGLNLRSNTSPTYK